MLKNYLQKLWFMEHRLVTLRLTINENVKITPSFLPKKHSGGDSVVLGVVPHPFRPRTPPHPISPFWDLDPRQYLSGDRQLGV